LDLQLQFLFHHFKNQKGAVLVWELVWDVRTGLIYAKFAEAFLRSHWRRCSFAWGPEKLGMFLGYFGGTNPDGGAVGAGAGSAAGFTSA
jgi:hypothetical protein